MFDVVVVGNAGIDTTVYLDDPIDLGRETDYAENVDGVGQSGGYAARGVRPARQPDGDARIHR